MPSALIFAFLSSPFSQTEVPHLHSKSMEAGQEESKGVGIASRGQVQWPHTDEGRKSAESILSLNDIARDRVWVGGGTGQGREHAGGHGKWADLGG